jgi:alpha-tubulin suppressor-like RCC1 family protein
MCSKVFVFGLNKGGALGLGHEQVQSVPHLNNNLKNVKAIAGGASHTVVLFSNGDVATFGSNEYGECGLGHFNQSVTTPQKINVKNIIKIASSNNCGHTLLLDNKGAVYSFGTGNFGQLGLGDLEDKNTPQLITAFNGINITSIEAGGNGTDGYSLALTDKGDLYAWGSNEFGQLGLDDCNKRTVPTKVDVLSKITMISAGSNHTLALRANGQLFSFGRNDYGQLGHNDVEHKYSPEEVPVLRNKKISVLKAAGEYSIALLEDGTLYVWGSSDEGQLGMGDKRQRDYPVIFTGLPGRKIKKIATGWFHVLALADDNNVYSWGRNDDNQLGLGQLEDVVQTSPAEIVSLRGQNIYDVAVGCFNSFAFGSDEVTEEEPGMTLEDLEKWSKLFKEGKISAQVFQEKKNIILGL